MLFINQFDSLFTLSALHLNKMLHCQRTFSKKWKTKIQDAAWCSPTDPATKKMMGALSLNTGLWENQPEVNVPLNIRGGQLWGVCPGPRFLATVMSCVDFQAHQEGYRFYLYYIFYLSSFLTLYKNSSLSKQSTKKPKRVSCWE